MILILEDDPERIERFTAALRRVTNVEIRLWRNARTMLRELPSLPARGHLLSLDHDLAPEGEADPGTGSDLVRWLVTQAPACPVLIHMANSERAAWMGDALTASGWEQHRVPPLGEDWIEEDWRRLVRRLLRRARTSGG